MKPKRKKSQEVGEQEQSTIAEKRRQQIIATAVALFAERGYFQTKIEDISNAIGVGKGLIYRYFKDKNDVLFCALCAVLKVYQQENVVQLMMTLGPLAALRSILEVNCAMAHEHPQEVILAYRSTKDLMPEQRHQIMLIETEIAREIEQCLRACIAAGLMEPLDVKIMAYQYIMLGHTWALKSWALRGSYSMDNYLAEGERLLLLPYLTSAGRKKLATPLPTAKPIAKRPKEKQKKRAISK